MILNVISQIVGFIGSLCLLLFGMNMLSNGIQKGAGSGLQKLLGKITGNRFYAVLTGIGVTAIIQSSGATTVMVVSFVNAEILTLEQAIGVIFGANIGTTVTAWIVSLFGFSFSIAAMAIPLFGFGYILKYFKKFKILNFAESFMNPKKANDENDHVKFLENYIDEMNSAITDFLQKCARLPNANHDDRQHFSTLLHITDTLENLSDKTCSLMHTVKKYVSGEKYESTSRRSKEIEDYVERVGLNKLIIKTYSQSESSFQHRSIFR